jgi:hypothetical protein
MYRPQFIFAFVLLIVAVIGSVVPAQAQWLCFDPDGTVSLETDESCAECCARWRAVQSAHPQETPGQPADSGSHKDDCHDIAIGQGSKMVQHTATPDLSLAPHPFLTPLARDPFWDFPTLTPDRSRPLAHMLDPPCLAFLKTIILLV